MENKLIISVSGEVNSGKSRLTLLIKRFLQDNGFDVQFDPRLDYPTEFDFDKNIGQNFDKIIDQIKEARTIVIEEHQLNKPSIKMKVI